MAAQKSGNMSLDLRLSMQPVLTAAAEPHHSHTCTAMLYHSCKTNAVGMQGAVFALDRWWTVPL